MLITRLSSLSLTNQNYNMKRPGVGVGVIIQNADGKVLIGKRKGSHSPYYSIPGGHLENGETFEQAAIKEVYEETGLTIYNPIFVCVTNNHKTYQESNKHYISINMFVDTYDGELEVKEPEKCEGWFWCDIEDIPEPHFDASEFALECFKKKRYYIKDQR